eukprot:EG_transcript_16661
MPPELLACLPSLFTSGVPADRPLPRKSVLAHGGLPPPPKLPPGPPLTAPGLVGGPLPPASPLKPAGPSPPRPVPPVAEPPSRPPAAKRDLSSLFREFDRVLSLRGRDHLEAGDEPAGDAADPPTVPGPAPTPAAAAIAA